MALGPLFFAAPLALLTFAALPLLIWLLRATPPPPTRQIFPPLRLLLDIRTDESQRHRAPWWLVALRATLASLLILGFARPSWRPQEVSAALSGPLLLIIDDGWTSAPRWAAMRNSALAAIDETAERGGGPVTILTTAPQAEEQPKLQALAPPDAKARVQRLQPSAWRPQRKEAMRLLEHYRSGGRVVWLSDGLAGEDDAAFGAALERIGPLTIQAPPTAASALVDVQTAPDGLRIAVRRPASGTGQGAVAVETAEGRSLGAEEFRFSPSGQNAIVTVKLPAEIASRAARVRIVNEASAGAVRWLPNGAGRPVVGLNAAAGGDQPLLRELFYLERALQPFAATRSGSPAELATPDVQAIILADAGHLQDEDKAKLAAWVENGGLLLRFAGPRLANDPDDLLPAPLRAGSRSLGGALAWERPQRIAPFEPNSPFTGLDPAADVLVRQQVLAEPFGLNQALVWARLEDGTPIVTAAARKRGLIVLFHVGAGPAWSDLPLSGLYVEMLRRILAFAGNANAAAADTRQGPWTAERVLNGFGALQPPKTRISVEDAVLASGKPGPTTPPGLYSRDGSPQRVFSAASANETLALLRPPPGANLVRDQGEQTAPLEGWLLGAAALLAALDVVLALVLAGSLRWRLNGAPALLAAAALLVALQPPPAAAQINLGYPPGWGSDAPDAIPSPGDVRLAFIKTGDPRQDRITRAGLEALTQVLFDRTAVEPGAVAEIDLERDELSLYPLLYWAAPAQPAALKPRAVANLDRYMRLGGMLLLDTRAQTGGAAADAAKVMLSGLDAPPLQQLSAADSVYGKAFYLLRVFPGRRRPAQVWAETPTAAQARDGVASLIVGDGDWASAWAGLDVSGEGAPRQREMALRFGVNLVMVALTGNYKADQVHVPELLRRLGQSRTNP